VILCFSLETAAYCLIIIIITIIHICIIAPYGRNFRGAVARECASESEKREESKPERKGMSLA